MRAGRGGHFVDLETKPANYDLRGGIIGSKVVRGQMLELSSDYKQMMTQYRTQESNAISVEQAKIRFPHFIDHLCPKLTGCEIDEIVIMLTHREKW